MKSATSNIFNKQLVLQQNLSQLQ